MGEYKRSNVVVLDLSDNNLEFVPFNWLHATIFSVALCKEGDGMSWN